MALSETSAGTPIFTAHVGDGRVRLDPLEGLGSLEVHVNSVRFRPLAGASAIGADGEVDLSTPLEVEATAERNVLRLTVRSCSPQARGVCPGLVEGLGEWRRQDLSRHAEVYHQP